jgi:hypothetical protein
LELPTIIFLKKEKKDAKRKFEAFNGYRELFLNELAGYLTINLVKHLQYGSDNQEKVVHNLL